ncbi:MAG: DUF1080 domain-containing protein [Planctomycetia bacterium]|nr:DUF1080 domain-containing protein [Planctomycetia bacterium]
MPVVGTAGGKPPSDALIVFDGSSTKNLVGRAGGPCRWPVENGALVAQRDGGLWTKLHFRDAQVHAEFATPADGKGEAREGNSGLYFHGLFEMQIINPGADDATNKHLIGAIYNVHAPLVNAGRAPGEWQVYDVIYVAPRHDAAGKVTQPGSITALLNGVLVQNHVEFSETASHFAPLKYQPNPYVDRMRKSLAETDTGPMQLQDHGSPVRFRNIWIRPLDDKARDYDGK